jgi:hypothetical protein
MCSIAPRTQGLLVVESTVDCGTSFIVTFPCSVVATNDDTGVGISSTATVGDSGGSNTTSTFAAGSARCTQRALSSATTGALSTHDDRSDISSHHVCTALSGTRTRDQHDDAGVGPPALFANTSNLQPPACLEILADKHCQHQALQQQPSPSTMRLKVRACSDVR